MHTSVICNQFTYETNNPETVENPLRKHISLSTVVFLDFQKPPSRNIVSQTPKTRGPETILLRSNTSVDFGLSYTKHTLFHQGNPPINTNSPPNPPVSGKIPLCRPDSTPVSAQHRTQGSMSQDLKCDYLGDYPTL